MDSQARGRPRISLDEYKDLLYRLYITERRAIKDIQQYIKEYHSVEAR